MVEKNGIIQDLNLEKLMLRKTGLNTLNKKSKPVKSNEQHAKTKSSKKVELSITEDIIIRGEILDCTALNVSGSLQTQRFVGKKLVVDETGRFEGRAEVETAIIKGHFSGELLVSKSLTVESTGEIIGKIFYKKISVENGGKISGTMAVGDSQEQALGFYKSVGPTNFNIPVKN